MTTASDHELISATLAGDKNAFTQLVRRHERRVEVTVRGVMGDIPPQDVADAAQDIFILAYRALGSFRGDSKFSTWLTRIALRYCYRSSRRRRRRSALFGSFADGSEGSAGPLESQVVGGAAADGIVLGEERRNAVLRALNALPEEFRAVLVLRVVEEMSVEEVADALDVSTGTVKSRLHRAKEKMRELLVGRDLEFEYAAE